MSARKRRTPAFLHAPIAAALRTAVTAPLVAGLPLATSVAESLGRGVASMRFMRSRVARAEENLLDAFPHWSPERRHEHALHSFAHLCRLGVEFLYTPRLVTHDGWLRHLALTDLHHGLSALLGQRPCILITGHCGNWELVGAAISMLGFPMHAVYRPLDQRPLDAWVRAGRERVGLHLVSKFGAIHRLPEALAKGLPVGFVADQNGGDRGVFVPFFGRLTSTYKSIGLLAIQFQASIVCGTARRVPAGTLVPRGIAGVPVVAGADGLGYVIDIIDVFGPEQWSTHPDPLYYLTARYRRAIEIMIRRAPEQFLWMHRIWRSRPLHERAGKPFPRALREKMEALPWMSADDVARVVERSERESRSPASAARPPEPEPDPDEAGIS